MIIEFCPVGPFGPVSAVLAQTRWPCPWPQASSVASRRRVVLCSVGAPFGSAFLTPSPSSSRWCSKANSLGLRRHDSNHSSCTTFHFRHYRSYSCLPPTLFVTLPRHLPRVPHSGFISPNARVTALFTLKKLDSLWLDFYESHSCAHRENRHPPAVTRTIRSILQALTDFRLWSDVEDFTSQIDTPILDEAVNQNSTHPLRHFISRTEAFSAPRQAEVVIGYKNVSLTFL